MMMRGDGHEPTDIQALEDNVIQREEEKALRSERTKNGVCKKFLHSICKRENCPHIHDKKRAERCMHYEQNNQCNKGDSCDFRHDMDNDDHSKQICKYFRRYGYCNKGANCQYKHMRVICKAYEQGFCPLGDACVKIHKEVKACPNYLFGFCPNGPDCLLAHPKQFYDFDKSFLERMMPGITIVICHKCKQIGHKANNCEKEIGFETTNPAPFMKVMPPPPPPPSNPPMHMMAPPPPPHGHMDHY